MKARIAEWSHRLDEAVEALRASNKDTPREAIYTYVHRVKNALDSIETISAELVEEVNTCMRFTDTILLKKVKGPE